MNFFIFTFGPVMTLATTALLVAGSLVGLKGSSPVARIVSLIGALLVASTFLVGLRVHLYFDPADRSPSSAPSSGIVLLQMILMGCGWLVFSIGYFALSWTEKARRDVAEPEASNSASPVTTSVTGKYGVDDPER